MAEPTIDSLGGGGNAVPPLAGEGSKTPPTPGKGLGAGTPLGGGPAVEPMGTAGAPPTRPKTPDQQAEDDLNERAVPGLISDVVDGLQEIGKGAKEEIKTKYANLPKSKIYSLFDYLLSLGWTEQQLESMAREAGMSKRQLIEELVNKVQTGGEEAAEKFFTEKIQENQLPDIMPSGPPVPGTSGGPAGGLKSPPPEIGTPGKGPNPTLPPMQASPGLPPKITANLSDVGLNEINFKIREAVIMDKVIVTKDGTLEKVADGMSGVLEKLALAIRDTRTATKQLEDTKLKYAGTIALKLRKAEFPGAEKEEGEEKEEVDEFGGEEDLDEGLGEGDIDKQMVTDGIDKVQEGMSMIQDAMGGVEQALEGPGVSSEDMTKAEPMMGIAAATLNKAKEVVKTAKKDMEALNKKKDKKKVDSKMQKAMLGGSGKKIAAEGEEVKEEKEEEKKEETSEKDAGLVAKVKARLAELRAEKEANLYPFNKDPYGSADAKVDNINAENAKQQASTANSEIKAQPVTDKDNSRINSELGQKDLPYKTEGKNTADSKVNIPDQKKVGSDVEDVENAFSKSRLAVELASLQQLKGLITNPLKEAFVNSMVEAGINKEAAEGIAENAFIDGYEASQKVVMKEAFETFVKKPYEDFVKVSQFTQDYTTKKGDVFASVEDAEGRDKTASTNPPFRGSKVGDHGEDYKNYWQQVKRERRGF
jgi:hypothetical protein